MKDLLSCILYIMVCPVYLCYYWSKIGDHSRIFAGVWTCNWAAILWEVWLNHWTQIQQIFFVLFCLAIESIESELDILHFNIISLTDWSCTSKLQYSITCIDSVNICYVYSSYETQVLVDILSVKCNLNKINKYY